MLGPGHEATRHRGLGGPRAGLDDLGADWFQPGRVAARRQLGQHPLHRQLVEQVGGGERLVGRHGQLAGAVGGPDPRSAYPHPAAAQGHLARLAAMTDRGPLREVAALGPDQPGDVFGEHGLKHLQAGPHGQGQQPLTGGAGKLGDRDGHLLGQMTQDLIGGGGVVGILRHGLILLPCSMSESVWLIESPSMGLFVGPRRAKSWKTDDWAGPAGRARIRAQSQTTNLRLRRRSHISASLTMPDDTFWSPATLLVSPPLWRRCRGWSGSVAPREAGCNGEHPDDARQSWRPEGAVPAASTARSDSRSVCLTARFVGFRLLWLPQPKSSPLDPGKPATEGTAMTYLRAIRRPRLRWIVTAALLVSLAGLVLSQVGAADAAGSRTAGAARAGAATSPGGAKPTVVLVHGAWADSGSWDQVVARLQRHGYTVVAFPNPLRGLPDDSAYLAAFLQTIRGPIVLVGHSYGGMVITNAATGNA